MKRDTFSSNGKMYLSLKKTSFTVFLLQQKKVSSQTEEEQILSTSDDNIVKVFLSSVTRDAFSFNRKISAFL